VFELDHSDVGWHIQVTHPLERDGVVRVAHGDGHGLTGAVQNGCYEVTGSAARPGKRRRTSEREPSEPLFSTTSQSPT
jgi:hypothetical protein